MWWWSGEGTLRTPTVICITRKCVQQNDNLAPRTVLAHLVGAHEPRDVGASEGGQVTAAPVVDRRVVAAEDHAALPPGTKNLGYTQLI